MLTLLMILAVLIAIVLIAVVLIQNPKGSGLAANFSTGNQFFGVKKTTDIVEKATWLTAALVMAISLISTGYLPKGNTQPGQSSQKGKIDEQLEEIMQKGLPATTPASPFENTQDAPQQDPFAPAAQPEQSGQPEFEMK